MEHNNINHRFKQSFSQRRHLQLTAASFKYNFKLHKTGKYKEWECIKRRQGCKARFCGDLHDQKYWHHNPLHACQKDKFGQVTESLDESIIEAKACLETEGNNLASSCLLEKNPSSSNDVPYQAAKPIFDVLKKQHRVIRQKQKEHPEQKQAQSVVQQQQQPEQPVASQKQQLVKGHEQEQQSVVQQEPEQKLIKKGALTNKIMASVATREEEKSSKTVSQLVNVKDKKFLKQKNKQASAFTKVSRANTGLVVLEQKFASGQQENQQEINQNQQNCGQQDQQNQNGRTQTTHANQTQDFSSIIGSNNNCQVNHKNIASVDLKHNTNQPPLFINTILAHQTSLINVNFRKGSVSSRRSSTQTKLFELETMTSYYKTFLDENYPVQEESKVFEGLKLIKSLGAGSEGDSLLYQDEQLQNVVIKRIFIKNLLELKPFIAEFETMRTTSAILMFMEYIDGHTLRQLIQQLAKNPTHKISQWHLNTIVQNTIRAVWDLHNVQLVHRDIKPDNIIVRKKGLDIVLIDFGFVIKNTNVMQQLENYGTKDYKAPELFQDSPGLLSATDIWSIGVTVLELLGGLTQLDNEVKGNLRTRERILLFKRCEILVKELPDFLKACNVSQFLSSILTNSLVLNQDKRMLINQLNLICQQFKNISTTDFDGFSSSKLQWYKVGSTKLEDFTLNELIDNQILSQSVQFNSIDSQSECFATKIKSKRKALTPVNELYEKIQELKIEHNQKYEELEQEYLLTKQELENLRNFKRHRSCSGANSESLASTTKVTNIYNNYTSVFLNVNIEFKDYLKRNLKRVQSNFQPFGLKNQSKILCFFIAAFQQMQNINYQLTNTLLVDKPQSTEELFIKFTGQRDIPQTQQDAHEFLGKIYGNCDHVRSFFVMKTHKVISCKNCNTIKNAENEDQWCLSLPVCDDLQLSIEAYFSFQGLIDYNCDNCLSTNCEVQQCFDEANSILTIAFMRFGNGLTKNCNDITVPLTFRVLDHEYELFAFVSHIGVSLQSGHYIQCYKSIQGWECLDDDRAYVLSNLNFLKQAFICSFKKKNSDCSLNLEQLQQFNSQIKKLPFQNARSIQTDMFNTENIQAKTYDKFPIPNLGTKQYNLFNVNRERRSSDSQKSFKSCWSAPLPKTTLLQNEKHNIGLKFPARNVRIVQLKTLKCLSNNTEAQLQNLSIFIKKREIKFENKQKRKRFKLIDVGGLEVFSKETRVGKRKTEEYDKETKYTDHVFATMCNKIKLADMIDVQFATGLQLRCSPEDILDHSLTQESFVDSMRVEIPVHDLSKVKELINQGSIQIPSKQFVEGVFDSKIVAIDSNVKQVGDFAYNISIKNETDAETAAFTKDLLSSSSMALLLLSKRHLILKNFDCAQDFNFSFDIPSFSQNGAISLLTKSFSQEFKELEYIDRHCVIFHLTTGQRVKIYDKWAELLTSSSITQRFNSPQRFLRYVALNKILTIQNGQTRVEVSFTEITTHRVMLKLFNGILGMLRVLLSKFGIASSPQQYWANFQVSLGNMITVVGPSKQFMAYAKNSYHHGSKFIGYYGNEIGATENSFFEFCQKFTPCGVTNYAVFVLGYDSYKLFKIIRLQGGFYCIPLGENPFCKQPYGLQSPFNDIKLSKYFNNEPVEVLSQKFKFKEWVDNNLSQFLDVNVMHMHNVQEGEQNRINKLVQLVRNMAKEGSRNIMSLPKNGDIIEVDILYWNKGNVWFMNSKQRHRILFEREGNFKALDIFHKIAELAPDPLHQTDHIILFNPGDLLFVRTVNSIIEVANQQNQFIDILSFLPTSLSHRQIGGNSALEKPNNKFRTITSSKLGFMNDIENQVVQERDNIVNTQQTQKQDQKRHTVNPRKVSKQKDRHKQKSCPHCNKLQWKLARHIAQVHSLVM